MAEPPGLDMCFGREFRDPALLQRALTPPSSGLAAHNQRLEFLGDALLNAAVALLVHREKPDWAEGELSKLRGLLVRRDALLAWARDLGLRLASGPRSSRKADAPGRDNSLADAIEALLAALFLDARASGEDGFQAVLSAVEGRFLAAIRSADPGGWQRHDSKTALQERAARLGWAPPRYEQLGRSGPDHAPRFMVRAEAGGHSAVAAAGTLKKAEAEAARALLDRLPAETPPPLSSSGKLG